MEPTITPTTCEDPRLLPAGRPAPPAAPDPPARRGRWGGRRCVWRDEAGTWRALLPAGQATGRTYKRDGSRTVTVPGWVRKDGGGCASRASHRPPRAACTGCGLVVNMAVLACLAYTSCLAVWCPITPAPPVDAGLLLSCVARRSSTRDKPVQRPQRAEV